jgi:tripartite-type tricarboxylate transporter receptor subunit TctC
MRHPQWFALACALVALPAAAEYPVKPIRIIVQFGPGTSTDILARLVAQQLTEALGKQVVVDNRPGAGAVIGTEIGARAAPDGYTLTMAVSSAFGINPSLYKKLPYDAVKDFAPITNLATVAQTLVCNPTFAAKTVQELVALAKQKPGELAYGSLGSGTTSHLTMEMFRAAAGIRLNHIPFKGSGEAHAQIMGGQVPFMFDAMPAVQAHIRAGRLRGLAVSTRTRSPFLPELPTVAESGYPEFEAVGWIGIAAPAGTPVKILDLLHRQITAMLAKPEVKERLAQLAFAPVGDSREAFAAFIRSEIAKWGRAVKESGAKVE